MDVSVKLLLLEDDPLDAELNITALEAEGDQCEWERVQTKGEFIDALEEPSYDLILIDYNLPAFDGMSALHILRERGLDIPALLVSGNLGEELAIDSIKAGAVDYVHKDRLSRLAPSVKRALKESKLHRLEKVQANNLALFSKLNQAANSGASISKLITILSVETSGYANYFGATTFLLSEDKKFFKMQYLALPNNLREKIEKTIGKEIPAIRIEAEKNHLFQQSVKDEETKIINTEKEIEQFVSGIILSLVGESGYPPLKKLSSLIRKILSLKAIAFLPLVIDGRSIGVLVFPYQEKISPSDIHRMEAIAEQLIEIFARKMAEEEVKKLHRQQKMILNSVSEGIVGVDVEGNLIFANPSASLMLGWSEEDICVRGCHEILRPISKSGRVYAEEECPIYSTYTFGDNMYEEEAEFWRKDFGYFPVFFSSTVIETEGNRVGAVITFRDITKQVEASREIARLAEVVKQASVAVVITDLEGDIVYTNPYFEKSSGYSVDEALGNNPRVLKSGYQDDSVYKELWETIKKGDAWQNTLINKRKDGSFYHEDANIFPIKTVEGEIINYAAVKRDITAQVRAEEQIRLQLSRLDSLHSIDAEILSNLDLKAILAVVLAQVEKGLGADAANVLFFNPSTQSLERIAQFGFRTDNSSYKRLRLGKGLAGKAALDRESIFIQDVHKEDNPLAQIPSLRSEGFRSYFGLPLLAQGKLKGVLEVFHRSVLEPNAEWLKFLNMLAGQTAIAIDNISLFENLQKNNTELRLAYDTTLEGWARALELRDMETVGHSRRVTALTIELATAMGMDRRLMDHIRRGALLHDIGKMGVPDAILNKPAPLTDIEWTVMKQHPVMGYEMLKEIIYLKPALDIPYSHHERWDGSGYPLGMHGEAIPLAARVFAVIDVYDALTSDRPYRIALSKEETLAYIGEQSGTHFDPEIVDVFMEMMKDKGVE